MPHSRRDFIKAVAAAAAFPPASRAVADPPAANPPAKPRKRHLITLSFDDGFRKSFLRTAEIYEKHKLSACLNVLAAGHRKDFRPPGEYLAGSPRGDFVLWNELQKRGHEIMPHGYRHANLRQLPFEEARDLILRCLDVFDDQLKDFDRKQAVFYRGPWKAVIDDDGHKLLRGQRMAVCDKTFSIYTRPPYADHVDAVPPHEAVPLEAAQQFSCQGSPLRSPRETKGGAERLTLLPSEDCCGPSGDCC